MPRTEDDGQAEQPTASDATRSRGVTIGAVCQTLRQEFPDISISKIRYLEDQRLITPERTAGGYRLYSQGDIDRLRAILRMQRDEFLPLRIIRQELAAGRGSTRDAPTPSPQRAASSTDGAVPAGANRHHANNISVLARGSFHRQEDVLAEARAEERLLKELADFGLITGHSGKDGGTLYDDAEREIVVAAAALARYGIGARHLRTFRSSADREAGLLQQLLGPALQSRNPERRKEAIDVLDDLAVTVSRLSHLLLVRDLRRITD
ncbi:MAG: MerR family transcriptional regulator [Solirubrobacteraceae bacterium]|nr:MerR family transcriptional regulator [Solirubrobacteraceae bacterium]